MKFKRIITLSLAAAMAMAATVSVAAADLTDQNTTGNTEVKARINGSAGNVTYTITIPDVIDFGVLEQPTVDENSYKYVPYTVTATKIEGIDPSTQEIGVYVKDQNADSNGDTDFYIINKTDSSIKFKYDVFFSAVDDTTNNPVSINSGTMTGTAGYKLHNFSFQGEEVNGTLRLNQQQLYGRNITAIAGDYSGYMVFFSTVENIP